MPLVCLLQVVCACYFCLTPAGGVLLMLWSDSSRWRAIDAFVCLLQVVCYWCFRLSPAGGVLFALEEGASHWQQELTWNSFVSAGCAAATLNILKSTINNEKRQSVLDLPARIIAFISGKVCMVIRPSVWIFYDCLRGKLSTYSVIYIKLLIMCWLVLLKILKQEQQNESRYTKKFYFYTQYIYLFLCLKVVSHHKLY